MTKKTSPLALTLIICIYLMMPGKCFAKDFGKMANTFEIKEEGFVEMIKRKLSGIDMEKENEKMQRIAKERIENPKPVSFIKKAQESRTFYFDPTITLMEDILLPDGKVLHKAGKKINPLDHMSLNRRMFFVDASDHDQVKWLKNCLKEYENKQSSKDNKSEPIENRIILVKGKIFELQKELDRTVYFDQEGELTSRFGIKSVPAIAIEEDKKIKITEVNMEDDADNLNKEQPGCLGKSCKLKSFP